ncbi:hypothetical protein B0H63DRAFT_469875 [Podospora didyma]|uniref:RING-type domain-containing protein n=1 Tax=Podospora didyma TaxID=330526 RepID=A0AAE0NTF8_9PEZI|nr:hypothetical protein B0H63DRAFT_469875 [Podospora didyma]
MSGEQSLYCHGCHHQWQADGHSIECPTCHSSTTEIITPDNDPRHFHNGHPSTQAGAAVNSDDTMPSDSQPATSAPQQPQVTAGNNNNVNNNDASTQHGNTDPSAPANGSHPPEIRFVFAPQITFFTTIVPQSSNTPSGPMPAFFSFPLQFFTTHPLMPSENSSSPPQGASAPTESATTPSENANRPSESTNTTAENASSPPPGSGLGPTFLAAMVSSIFNPANAVFGDAVYSEAALNAVLAHFASTPQGNRPSPAPQTAIDSLKVKELDEDTQCAICLENMAKCDKATVLPCSPKHVFHGECVNTWLKQANSCPQCRKPLAGAASEVSKPPPSPLAEGQDRQETATS